MKADTDAVGLDYNPILTYTTAEAAKSATEAIPGHATVTADAITRVLSSAPHAPSAYSHCSHHDTPHWRSSLHRSSSAYSRDHSRS